MNTGSYFLKGHNKHFNPNMKLRFLVLPALVQIHTASGLELGNWLPSRAASQPSGIQVYFSPQGGLVGFDLLQPVLVFQKQVQESLLCV